MPRIRELAELMPTASASRLPDAELLTRLMQLNQQRVAEEAAGIVRYLRPAYKAPANAISEQI
jgi:hypothetical protein